MPPCACNVDFAVREVCIYNVLHWQYYTANKVVETAIILDGHHYGFPTNIRTLDNNQPPHQRIESRPD